MVMREAAPLIKRYGKWAVAGTNLKDLILLSVMVSHKFDQPSAVSLSLKFFCDSEILYLQYAFAFICDDAFALYNAIIFKNKHRASVEIKIVFLLVCQQEQGKIP